MKHKKISGLGIVVLFGIIPVLGLLHSGIPKTHDGLDQITRIASFYTSLLEGNIIPRWAGNLNWGYGHPILMFLYPLSSYSASFFHIIGFSFVDATKIIFGLGMVISGITMYLWLSEITETPESVFGAILYMFSPYRFIDVYVRGDIGENLAFVFVPLVCFFLVKLYRTQTQSYIIGLEISLASLVLSHNAISLMFLPFIIFYILYLFWKGKKNRHFLISALFGMTGGFFLSAFFWIPGILEGKYTLRNIVTRGGYAKNFVDPRALLYGPWSYGGSGQFSVQLGILNWIGLLLSPFFATLLFLKKNKRYLFILGVFLYTVFAIFLMLSFSNSIWSRFILLQNFQFPWRFLAVTVFTTTVLLTLFLGRIPKKRRYLLIATGIFSLLILNKDYWQAKGYMYPTDKQFTGIYHGTTDTGESAPVWSVRFMEKEPVAHMEIINGAGNIEELKRTTTRHQYRLILTSESRIRENTLYFPGWEVFVDGVKTPAQFQDPKNRGLITFFVPKGIHRVLIVFTETKIRLLADLLSLFTLASIGFSVILKGRVWQRFR